jgi:5-methylcytosine-specific restriction protein A
MAVPIGFNPAVDRYDPRSVAHFFQHMWPAPAIARACAQLLATSIRVAHNAGENCWGVTLQPNFLRLNVGQVEVLALYADFARIIFEAPLHQRVDRRYDIRISQDPVYPAVPVSSGICLPSPTELATLPGVIVAAHEVFIKSAASYKRATPHKKGHSPAVLEYLEATLGDRLPRPGYALEGANERVQPLPDELDLSMPLHEGARYRVTVNAYERDPHARARCIEEHGTSCVICGFSFVAAYGPVGDGFIHVHHVRPLSEIGEEYEVDPIQDLRPVCPNCHAMLHRRVPAYSIDEVRAFLRPSRRG